MRKWIVRRILRAVSRRYGYDTSYLETMLDEAPTAFFKFARIIKVTVIAKSFPSRLIMRPRSWALWQRIALPRHCRSHGIPERSAPSQDRASVPARSHQWSFASPARLVFCPAFFIS
jgi:hypothetical protein